MPDLIPQIIDVDALDVTDRDAFADELYDVHCRIFDGVGRDAFMRYVIDSPARRTRLKVLREQGESGPGRIVGYAAFHMFECTVPRRRCFVIRGEVGMLPEYRRGSLMGSFMLRETIAARLRHPTAPMYSLICSTNPASYRTVTRYSDRVWPHWERPTPPSIASLMRTLAKYFHLEPVAGATEGVYDVGWRPRHDAREDHGLRNSDHPSMRFYVERNPGFSEGHGMLSLVSLDLRSLVRTAVRLGLRQLGRGIGGL